MSSTANPSPSGISEELTLLTPSPLELPPVWVGARATGSVVVWNEGRVERTLSIAVDAPFSVEVPPGGLIVSPGSKAEVVVQLSPPAPGAHTGGIHFTSEGTELSLELRGVGLEQPACDATTSCTREVFDIEEGRCVVEPAPDGTPCEAPCLVDAACFGGQCAGRSRSCDDANLCTRDACSSTGCVHIPIICPLPESPCLAASCDPQLGCTQTPVADGTPCGRLGCDVQDICVGGACVERETPDGAPCGHPSPCQAQGTCSAKTCVRPPPVPLQPEWTRPMSNHARQLPVDLDGNLYSVDRTPYVPGQDETMTLVSLAPDGGLRWEVPVPQGVSHMQASAVLGDLLIAIDGSSEYQAIGVNAFRRSDGAHYGTLALTPSLQRRWFAARTPPSLVSGARLGVRVATTGCPSLLGVLETNGGTMVSTQPLVHPGWRYGGYSTAVKAGAAFEVILWPQPAWNVCSSDGLALRRFDLETGLETWRRTVGGPTHGTALPPLLTDADTVLIASGERVPNPAGGNSLANLTLHETGFDGVERFACPVSQPVEPWYSEPVLAAGRWILYDHPRRELVAFPVLGRGPSPSGWLNGAGNPQRTSQER